MSAQPLKIEYLQTIVEDKDYGTFATTIIAAILFILNYLMEGTAFLAIAALYRVLFLSIKKRRENNAYRYLCTEMTKDKKGVHTQQEVRFEDLQNWLPKTPSSTLRIFWKRLQEEEVILKDGDRWIIGSSLEKKFHFITVGA